MCTNYDTYRIHVLVEINNTRGIRNNLREEQNIGLS